MTSSSKHCFNKILINSPKKSTKMATTENKGKQNRSKRSGLTFPVGRIHRMLKNGNYSERIGAGT